ncbi:uncharacterized protein LOC130443027 [Diorhabda sublineata]|uniref:uncharacterized protein LOC130443027 n=1 Tax=Diorhabda sublineata TaxID=1163346 RepID=UPI0024E050C2|nr:uncharacterized protein LOC130443027 [Diorhabda sublineata]
MGGKQSKKTSEQSKLDLLTKVDDSVQNVNSNVYSIGNLNDSGKNGTVNLNKLDRQHIEYIKQDLRDTPELFVLNNMIMAVMFFEDYNKCKDNLLQNKLRNPEDFITPDDMFEFVNENTIFRPHHGPKKFESEPLIPKRIFMPNNTVRVLGSTEDAVEENNDEAVVRIEESQRKGYIKLRELKKTNIRDSGSPILPLDSIESNSRSSSASSETAYTTISNLKTPKPMDINAALEKQASQSTGFPRSCFSYRKIKKISWDPDELKGENISEDDLFEIVSYINSKNFMTHIQNEPILNEVASKLGVDLEDICEAKVIQEKIYCNVSIEEKYIPCEIMPCIKAKWPLEQTLTFLSKGERDAEPRQRFVFPTSYMIEEIKTLDCVLLPKGYIETKGKRNDVDISWELCFPQAQKYLETCMSYSQIKSLLLLITLHKTFIEPKTKHLGLTVDHIRNFLLLECESNCSDWPEHRLGSKLIKVIKRLNSHLSKAHPHIPDFFVSGKNILNDVANREIRKSHKVLDEILQAPVMHFMIALRNIRYTNGKTFYPPLNFKNLYDILVKTGIEHSNPQLAAKTIKKPKYSDPEMTFLMFKDVKKRRTILKQRIEQEEMEERRKKEAEDKRRGSIDSINVEWTCEKDFDIHKKRALILFFINTFLGIAKKGLKLSKMRAKFYLKQAYYLAKILEEQCPAFTDDVKDHLKTINELEKQCVSNYGHKEDLNSTRPFNKKVPITNITNTKKITAINEGKTRKSVTFIENHKKST